MRMIRSLSVPAAALIVGAMFASCADQPTAPEAGVTATEAGETLLAKRGQANAEPDHSALRARLAEVNERLADDGLAVRTVEYVTAASSDRQGQIVFVNDRGNKQLDHDFVPGDARRGGRTNITYAIDGTEAATANGVTGPETIGAIDAAMATWDAATCSDLNMTNLGVTPFDAGFIEMQIDDLLGTDFGGSPPLAVDILHAGWLPAAFFDLLAEDGSTFILGVTFTFTFGTDIDGNGKGDVAFREIYYNDAFPWGIDETGTGAGDPIDVESVALHEAGHGLSQAHFGRIFGTFANGKLHFAPEAVMNAAVFGQKQDLLATDTGGHCSIWGSWPND